MADYKIKGETLTQMADAIRVKTGETEKINPKDFATKILSLKAKKENE